ncbi:MAG: ComF family protein [Parcubacteria group bacterium]|jgi:competence protein ComFC
MPNYSKLIRKNILDTLFPITCLRCGKEKFWLCPECLPAINPLDYQLCPDCEKFISEKGALCPRCKKLKGSYLDSLIAAASYDSEIIRRLVHNLKYRFVADSSVPLSDIMTRALIKNDILLPDFIVPVPLHPRRLRWRGFNQSFLLAKKISLNLAPSMEIKVIEILQRDRNSKAQMKISRFQERLRNVKGIFSIKTDFGENILKKKSVLLVDDIATTGATLQECAKILKQNGAKKVSAAVISRQTFKK